LRKKRRRCWRRSASLRTNINDSATVERAKAPARMPGRRRPDDKNLYACIQKENLPIMLKLPVVGSRGVTIGELEWVPLVGKVGLTGIVALESMPSRGHTSGVSWVNSMRQELPCGLRMREVEIES
jgi:hypothetical protein